MSTFQAKENTLLAIGNTPLVRLNKVTRGVAANVYARLEYFNPTGSYKDRMALAMKAAGSDTNR
jgi:cysteine synthase